MARLRSAMVRAAALHRHAAAMAAASRVALDETVAKPTYTEDQYELSELLGSVALRLAPGWLGAPLVGTDGPAPIGGDEVPVYVRVGTAHPLDNASFPAIVPLLTHGHLAIDVDANDLRVAGAFRALVLRLLATTPAGTLRVRTVDATIQGSVFDRFAPLSDTTLMPPPVTDHDGLRVVLDEAEQWIRSASAGRPRPARDRILLIVIAALPQIDMDDLARIVTVAKDGPATGVHLLVAGWPPPPFNAASTDDLMPLTTALSLGGRYARLGAPSGDSFGSDPNHTALGSPVVLDNDPPVELIDRVCHQLASVAQAVARVRLTDLLDTSTLWTEDAEAGLATTVGFAGDTPVVLRFNDLVPNWLLGGRAGAGKTAFLLNIVLGLATRYPPDELALCLLQFREGSPIPRPASIDEGEAWLPHLDVLNPPADAYGLAVLRGLVAELGRRAAWYERAEVTKFAEARAAGIALPRIVCVIDEFPAPIGAPITGQDAPTAADPSDMEPAEDATLPPADEARMLLDRLVRKGRWYGIHLVLASRTVHATGSVPATRDRDSVFAQFPVRIALPGGGGVLDPSNDAAAGLPIGAAVVNTAGGFGGPRGATRGHETTVHFPNPYGQAAALDELRTRIRREREGRHRDEGGSRNALQAEADG